MSEISLKKGGVFSIILVVYGHSVMNSIPQTDRTRIKRGKTTASPGTKYSKSHSMHCKNTLLLVKVLHLKCLVWKHERY